MKRSTWSKFAALALCSCVSVVACGDDDDSSGPGTAGTAGKKPNDNEGGDGPSTAGSSNTAGKGGTAGTAGTSTNAGEGGGSNGGAPAGGPGGAPSDAGSPNDGGASAEGGAAMGGAGGEGGSGNSCDVPASLGDLGATDGEASFDEDASSTIYSTALESDASDILQVELYDGYGAFTGDIASTGTFELTGDELNYATCGVCVVLRENQTNNGARGYYMATGGTVTITQLDPHMIGTLSNVTFEHVTIDDDTNESSPVGDDCGTEVTNMSFDAPVVYP